MPKKSLLSKIKSKYIIQMICLYLKDYNDNFIYKLVLYSKYFQSKLDIKLIDYQKKYFDKIKFLEKYLYTSSASSKSGWNLKEDYQKQFDKELLKYNIKNSNIEEIVINHFRNKQKIMDFSESIDFYSPFFDILSRTEMFKQFFNILIYFDVIRELNLKKEYKEKFYNLHKLNIIYSSLEIRFNDYNDIHVLKNFNIKFSQIKKLIISIDSLEQNNILYKVLTFENIKDNLIFLSLHLCNTSKRLDPDLLSKLNDFKSLQFLKLEEFEFYEPFILKIKNLKKLTLCFCRNIGFLSNIFANLKSLCLRYCFLSNNNDLLKMEELEEISIWKSNLILDFDSLKKLKNFEGQINYFLPLKNSLLENVNINLKENDIDYKSIITKLITKLNEIKITKKLIVELDNKDLKYILNDLQDKYPYLSNLTFKSSYDISNYSIIKKIIMKENLFMKNDYIIINVQYPQNINLYCNYEKLESICFLLHEMVNLKDSFPIFNNKCKVKFNSLNSFKLSTYDGQKISCDILNNLYNNIDNMPNLEYFELLIDSYDMDEELYKAFIQKIMSLKLIRIIIIMIKKNSNQNYYSKNEIQELFPNKNYDNYYQISIQKFN